MIRALAVTGGREVPNRKIRCRAARGSYAGVDGVMFKNIRRSWPLADTTIETVVTAAWMGLIAYGLFRLSELAF